MGRRTTPPDPVGRNPEPPRGVTVTPRTIGAAVLLVLLAVFIVENRAGTRIRFIVPVVHLPLSIALLAAVAVGVLAGFLLGRSRRRPREP